MSHRISTCKFCGAGIIWGVTDAGKKMPVDADPSELGTHVLIDWDPPRVVPVGAGELAFSTLPKHTPHFATCPNYVRERRPNGRPQWKS